MSDKCKHDLSYCGICAENKPDIKSYDPEYMGETMTECKFNDGDWYNAEDAGEYIKALQQRNAELEAKSFPAIATQAMIIAIESAVDRTGIAECNMERLDGAYIYEEMLSAQFGDSEIILSMVNGIKSAAISEMVGSLKREYPDSSSVMLYILEEFAANLKAEEAK